jgi:hypothetical protein
MLTGGVPAPFSKFGTKGRRIHPGRTGWRRFAALARALCELCCAQAISPLGSGDIYRSQLPLRPLRRADTQAHEKANAFAELRGDALSDQCTTIAERFDSRCFEVRRSALPLSEVRRKENVNGCAFGAETDRISHHWHGGGGAATSVGLQSECW